MRPVKSWGMRKKSKLGKSHIHNYTVYLSVGYLCYFGI